MGTVVTMAEGAMLTVVMGIGGKKETGRTRRSTYEKSMLIVLLVVATVSLAVPP
jgi:hypothetical protein